MVGLDLGTNALFALGKSEFTILVFLGFFLPILCLFCWFEGWVLADSGVCVCVDLFNVLRADTICEIA